MTKTIVIPEDLYNKAVRIAAQDHLSVEEFVTTVLADRIASRDYIERQAKLFNREEFERALNQIPDVASEEHDRI